MALRGNARRADRTYLNWRAYKRVRGRVRFIYIGRDWNREALAKFREEAGGIERQVGHLGVL